MHRRFAPVLVLGLSAALLTPVARAGVTYDPNSTRRISAFAGADSHSLTAPEDLGTFDGDVSADGSNADFHTTSRVTQHTVFDSDGIIITGRREFEVVTLNPQPSNTMGMGAGTQIEDGIKFTLDRPTAFTFSETHSFEVKTGAFDGQRFLALQGANGQVNLRDSDIRSGTLPAGDYVLGINESVDNAENRDPNNGKLAETYTYSLLFPAQTGGGGNDDDGGGPTPVPLPRAAWTGLTTLGLAGLAWLRHQTAVPRAR